VGERSCLGSNNIKTPEVAGESDETLEKSA
jgi:hypothetical protein